MSNVPAQMEKPTNEHLFVADRSQAIHFHISFNRALATGFSYVTHNTHAASA